EAPAAAGESATRGEPASAGEASAASPASARRDPARAAPSQTAAHSEEDHHDESDDSRDDSDEERAGEEPRGSPDDARADRRAEQPAEDRTQDTADYRYDDEQDHQQRIEAERLPSPFHLLRRGCWRRAFAADDRDDPVDARADSLREFALAERRRDGLGDDAPRRHVRQNALEPIADLDPHLPVVFRDEEQGTVVLTLAADLPLFGDADRVRFDRLRLSRRHHQHDELV